MSGTSRSVVVVSLSIAFSFILPPAPVLSEPQEPSAAKTIPPIDFARWARFIVRDFFAVEPYEKVLLMGDPDYFPGFLDALRAELLEARAVELGTILFDGAAVTARRAQVQPRASDPEYKRRADGALRRLFEDADVFLWLPYRHSLGYEPGDWRLWEHMVEGTRARGLHFHWIQNVDELSQAEIDTLSRMYAEALEVDYAALSSLQDRVIAAMKGQTLHVTTPGGTDLRMHLRPEDWIHKGDGRMDRSRAAEARSVRDREMELPAGAVRFIPDRDSVDGVLAAPSWAGAENVRFRFENGRIVSVTAEKNEPQALARWNAATGDKDRLAEVVIGTNLKLPREGPGGRPPYYGYGAGVLRIALGDNWESGGKNRSSLEAWFWFTDATVRAGAISLVEDGELKVR